MNYNLTRHIELLKRSEYFKNLGKSFFEEEPENILEFMGYKADIENYWKNRLKLFSMMEKFLNGTIDKKEFSDNIFELRRSVRREVSDRSAKLVSELNSGKLQDFNLNLILKECKSVSNIEGFLYIFCDHYDEDDSQKQKFSEQVKKCLLELQEVLEKTKGLDLDKYEN